MLADYLIELSEQNAQSTLALSKKTPVLVYFWSNTVPETVRFKQQLERLATEYDGVLILASLDCEQHPMLSAQFGVQTLPTLALFSNGQPVDGLEGPQTQDSVRDMLSHHLPSQDELAFKAAIRLMQERKFNEALSQLKTLDSLMVKQGEYKLALAECYIESQQFEQGENILGSILMQDQNAKYKSLLAKVELHKQAANSDEIRHLQQAFAENPQNHKLGFSLAIQLSQIHQQEQALDILLNILQKDLNFSDGEAKKAMMNILSSLGQGHELATRYRRKLYALLY